MNRETKVGLLVGLAFLIVIGVLLSDHVQSKVEPQPAKLVTSVEKAREGTLTPGNRDPGAARLNVPGEIVPVAVVQTGDSIANSGRPQVVIDVSGPGNSGTVLTPGPGATPPQAPRTDEVVIGPSSRGFAPDPVKVVETLVPPDHVSPVKPVVTPEEQARLALFGPQQGSTTAPSDPTPQVAKGIQHKAVEGDSVYKMARKYYGGYTKEREELIVRANPQMGKNARITVGAVYVIPPLPGREPVAQQAGATLPPTPPGGTVAPQPERKPEPKPVATVRTYTVKDGDNLWTIARRQLPAGVTLADLKAANKDVLKNGDVVKPGMQLKIPTAPAVAANRD